MVTAEVAGWKSKEPKMVGILGGDCRDKMADKSQRSYK